MELSDYRVQIDRIDRQLVELFAQRMETAAGIAAYKKEHGYLYAAALIPSSVDRI